ncbi:MAG: hypothetical protein KJ645_02955, partial [Planctomycetes bacterium]|nr:hypothetical protein [Planctomycetota bacterium]
KSTSFSYEGDHALDLGEIQLDPCGLLDLEVVDETFRPIQDYSVMCDGLRRFSSRSFKDLRRFDKLPLGLVAFTIHAPEYLEQSIEVTLETSHPGTARVVLIKK